MNPGPLAPEASALPGCATPRIGCFSYRANNLAGWPESTKWSRYHRADEKRGRPRGMSRHYSRDFPSAFWARDQCHSGAFLARSTRAGPCTAAKLPLFRRAIRTLPSYRPTSAPRRSRTPNLLIRSQTLYPVELWAQVSRGRCPRYHGRYKIRTCDLYDVNVAL